MWVPGELITMQYVGIAYTDDHITCVLLQAVHMSQKALTDTDASEGDVICAPKLLEVILQNCKGRVDECVPHFISLALGRQVTPLLPEPY